MEGWRALVSPLWQTAVSPPGGGIPDPPLGGSWPDPPGFKKKPVGVPPGKPWGTIGVPHRCPPSPTDPVPPNRYVGVLQELPPRSEALHGQEGPLLLLPPRPRALSTNATLPGQGNGGTGEREDLRSLENEFGGGMSEW